MEISKVMFVYVAAVLMLTPIFLQSEAFTTPFRSGKRQINQTEVKLSLLDSFFFNLLFVIRFDDGLTLGTSTFLWNLIVFHSPITQHRSFLRN